MARKYRDIPFITRYQWVFHLIALGVVGVVLSLAIQMYKNSPITNVDVNIKPIDGTRYLISKTEVEEMINKKVGYDVSRGTIKRLDLMDLEYLLDSDERIANAELYMDKNLAVHIDIDQKVPLVRILTDGGNYYLDDKGSYVPVSGHTVRVPVVTGQVDAYVPNYEADANNNLNAILKLSGLIAKDEFLQSLVEQINVVDGNKFVIAPKMGRNKIKLGDISNIEDKLYRLKVFYSKAISKYGIDKFSELDLQYDGKVFSKDES
jgi:cell division protein FtsQ